MAEIVTLGANFDLGFQSDISRDELNSRAAFRMKDWIPQLEAPVRKRGGWGYGTPDLSSLGGAGAASAAALGFLPFPGDGQLAVVSNTGAVYQMKRFDGAGGALVADTGDTSIVPTWPIIYYGPTSAVQYGIILPGYTQTAKVPKKYVVTAGVAAVSPLGPAGVTGAPMARTGFAWGDYLVLGNYYDPSNANALVNNRWAFSPLDAPNSAWVLSGASAATFDFPEEVLVGIPVLNSILVLGYNNCWQWTGDTPPPGGNMARKILFAGLGTLDGRSAVAWRNYAIWANSAGVYQSDGATLTDLTAVGGISIYYRQLVSGFAQTNGWSMAAGLYRDHYVLTIRNAAGVVVSTLVCDLTRKVWTEWTNVPAVMFAQRPAGPGTSLFGGDEELFFAHSTKPRIGTVSSLWTPSQTYQADADGTAVLPSLETPFYRVGAYDQKRIRRIFMGYDLRAGSGGTALAISYVLTPEPNAAYTAMTPNMPSSTKYQRKNTRVGRFALGVGFKITLSATAADAKLYSIEAEAHPFEPER